MVTKDVKENVFHIPGHGLDLVCLDDLEDADDLESWEGGWVHTGDSGRCNNGLEVVHYCPPYHCHFHYRCGSSFRVLLDDVTKG